MTAGLIQPSKPDLEAVPCWLGKKTLLWCVDYRSLNKERVKDIFQLPLFEECHDTLAGNLWFSKLDVNALYIKVNIEDWKTTAFITKIWLFKFTRVGPLKCYSYVCTCCQSRFTPVKVEDNPRFCRRWSSHLDKLCNRMIYYVNMGLISRLNYASSSVKQLSFGLPG